MHNCPTKVFRATCAVVFVTAIALSASEKKIQRADLPPAVDKTVVKQSQGAKIRGFNKETEEGDTFYEVELLVDGHSKDILMDKNGKVIEVEEQVAIADLPLPVRDELQAKAGKGQLTKVESIRKHDQIVAYEAEVLNGAKRSEVKVGPDGKPMDHEE